MRERPERNEPAASHVGWMIWLLALTAVVALGAFIEAVVVARVRTSSGGRSRAWHRHADATGACLSAACAVHCLLTPIVVTLLPLGALAFLVDEAFERALIISSLVLATASFCWGYRQHGRWRTLLILAAAAVLLVAVRPLANESWEPVAAGLGGFGLAAGHWLNRRLCRKCAECSAPKP